MAISSICTSKLVKVISSLKEDPQRDEKTKCIHECGFGGLLELQNCSLNLVQWILEHYNHSTSTISWGDSNSVIISSSDVERIYGLSNGCNSFVDSEEFDYIVNTFHRKIGLKINKNSFISHEDILAFISSCKDPILYSKLFVLYSLVTLLNYSHNLNLSMKYYAFPILSSLGDIKCFSWSSHVLDNLNSAVSKYYGKKHCNGDLLLMVAFLEKAGDQLPIARSLLSPSCSLWTHRRVQENVLKLKNSGGFGNASIVEIFKTDGSLSRNLVNELPNDKRQILSQKINYCREQLCFYQLEIEKAQIEIDCAQQFLEEEVGTDWSVPVSVNGNERINLNDFSIPSFDLFQEQEEPQEQDGARTENVVDEAEQRRIDIAEGKQIVPDDDYLYYESPPVFESQGNEVLLSQDSADFVEQISFDFSCRKKRSRKPNYQFRSPYLRMEKRYKLTKSQLSVVRYSWIESDHSYNEIIVRDKLDIVELNKRNLLPLRKLSAVGV